MSTSVRAAVVSRLVTECQRLEDTADSFAKYRDDPGGFFRDVLDWHPWGKQQEIAREVAAYDMVSVVSGNGVGKTDLAAAIVWWYVKTRGGNCRALLTSSKGDQTERGVWTAVRRHFFHAERNGNRLGGVMPKLGKTGWDGPSGEQILILTADQAEAFQGIRAPEMIIVADEASGIDDRIFEAMLANLSGGDGGGSGKLLLIGNPMKTTGFFANSHRAGTEFRALRISALESPNVIAGRTVIKGLTTRAWVTKMREKYGEDSPIYRIRVLGEFIENEAGKPIPLVYIEEAQARWAQAPATGLLCVGLDPAGPGQFGDLTAIVWRRGDKMLGSIAGQGWSEAMIVRHLLDVIAQHRVPGEIPRVIVDAGGPIGGPLLGTLKAIARGMTLPKRIMVFGVRASEKARDPNYTTRRDELFESLARWIKRPTAAIPSHTGLLEELHAPMWLAIGKDQLKLTDKREVKKAIGRSPDLADALALSVWNVDREANAQADPPPTVELKERGSAQRDPEAWAYDVQGHAVGGDGDDAWAYER